MYLTSSTSGVNVSPPMPSPPPVTCLTSSSNFFLLNTPPDSVDSRLKVGLAIAGWPIIPPTPFAGPAIVGLLCGKFCTGTGGCDKLGEIGFEDIIFALGFIFELDVVLVSLGGA